MSTQVNTLFPIFLQLEKMKVLLVGGGKVAFEKLTTVLGNSPGTHIRLVSREISEEVRSFALLHQVELVERIFLPEDVHGADIVLVAINEKEESRRIREVARHAGKLVNVADQPELCDFYMSSIVRKGQLKIAISTNGKSPTIAKRLRAVLQDLLPEELDAVLEQMHRIREELKGDFAAKVDQLNRITSVLASGKPDQSK